MLISILGDVGSGKTLLSTALAIMDDRPVFANYRIHIDRWKMFYPETLLKVPFGSLVIMDEAWSLIESRLTGRGINRFFSYILFESRKLGIDILMTDQLSRTIDPRFRDMTNIEIHCEAAIVGFEYHVFRLSSYRYFVPKTFIIPYEVAELIYPFYDSWEKIDNIDSDLIFSITKDKTDIIKEIDGYVEAVMKLYPIGRITRSVVSDFCLRNNLSKQYVGMMYDRIVALRAQSED